MTVALLPSFNVELPPEPVGSTYLLPIKPNLASVYDVTIDSREKADRFIELVGRLELGAIAFDTEFSFEGFGTILRSGATWHDPKSTKPLLLSLAAWLPRQERVIRCAWDLRSDAINAPLEKLFQLPVPFVAHHIQAELHTLWALGVDPEVNQVWDTLVAAKALDLGEIHTKRYNLLALCERYKIEHPFAATKEFMQNTFLGHADGSPFVDRQLSYAMSDAEVTLQVYLAQQNDVLKAGLGQHLTSVEFPFALANARMAWDGVGIDQKRVSDLRAGLDRAIEYYQSDLEAVGLQNPSSPRQVLRFLIARGHGDKLYKNGKQSTSDSVLESLEATDPQVTQIRRYRRYSSLRSDPMFSGELIGSDGRLHPNHRHFGAATGRSSCSAPNIVGISKTFRPVVVAPPGRVLVELDCAQIEVCIAAAVHGDIDLLEAANSEDVYSKMAQLFFAETLSQKERSMSAAEFKVARRDLRSQIKVFVLGIIFGMSEHGVADRFGVTLKEARIQLDAFFDRFPSIAQSMERAYVDGQVRGYSAMIGGLRRKIQPGSQAKNQHINTPVQGAAGVVFRRAVADMYRHFRGSTVQLVLPIHDAVLLECNEPEVDQVAGEAAFIMKNAVRIYFPQLLPKVDFDLENVECWNKDGRTDSIQAFINDPTFKL